MGNFSGGSFLWSFWGVRFFLVYLDVARGDVMALLDSPVLQLDQVLVCPLVGLVMLATLHKALLPHVIEALPLCLRSAVRDRDLLAKEVYCNQPWDPPSARPPACNDTT